MAKFRIWAKSIDYLYLDVEADTLDEAMEVADEADGGDFHSDASAVSWEMDENEVEELDDDADVDYTYEEMFEE